MFFLMRYQTVVATRREINLARQFCRVSLVHRMETTVARQFFEVSVDLTLVSIDESFALIFSRKSDLTSRKRHQRTKQPDKVRRGFSFLLWFGLPLKTLPSCRDTSHVSDTRTNRANGQRLIFSER
jgi:hypothetical protein